MFIQHAHCQRIRNIQSMNSSTLCSVNLAMNFDCLISSLGIKKKKERNMFNWIVAILFWFCFVFVCYISLDVVHTFGIFPVSFNIYHQMDGVPIVLRKRIRDRLRIHTYCMYLAILQSQIET